MAIVAVFVRLMCVVWLIASLAACSKAQARTEPLMALNVPPPPARVAVPVQIHEPEEAPSPEPAPLVAPPAAPARPRTEAGPGRGSERPAITPPAPANPIETTVPPVLQTTANVGALEQKATTLLNQAQGNLDRVNYRDLGVQAREQYDRALGFIKNARGALRIRNFMYAEQLAAKAAAVARELVKS